MDSYSNPILKPAMTKEELLTLPPFNHEFKYEMVETKEAALKAVDVLKQAKILGFDTETRPSFRKGEFHHVALIQLSTETFCYLFRLTKIPLMPEITQLLSDEKIIKVGVGIRDDIKALQKLAKFEPQNFIDLSEKTRISRSISLSLRSLCGMYLGQKLSKGAKITNWENPVLTDSQARYAANDAVVSVLIFDKMFAVSETQPDQGR